MSLTDCWIAAHALRAPPFSCAHTAGELIPKPNAARSPKTKFVLNFRSCSFIDGFNDVHPQIPQRISSGDKLSQKSEDVVWHPSGYDAGYREEERDNTTITITIRADPSNPGKTAPN